MKKTYLQPAVNEMVDHLEEDLLTTSVGVYEDEIGSGDILSRENDLWDEE